MRRILQHVCSLTRLDLSSSAFRRNLTNRYILWGHIMQSQSILHLLVCAATWSRHYTLLSWQHYYTLPLPWKGKEWAVTVVKMQWVHKLAAYKCRSCQCLHWYVIVSIASLVSKTLSSMFQIWAKCKNPHQSRKRRRLVDFVKRAHTYTQKHTQTEDMLQLQWTGSVSVF